MSTIGILITSRNNYEFTDKFWAPAVKNNRNIDQHEILNIDEDSDKDQCAYGREMCKRHNMVFMDREKRGMHQNLKTASDFFEPKGVKYIIWFQTDAWPIQDNFFNSFNALVESGSLDEFGTVGYNSVDSARLEVPVCEKMKKKIARGERPLLVVARSSLEDGDPWICGIKAKKTANPVKRPELFSRPFAVSVNNWHASAINIQQFRKHIDISRQFHFFHSWDDICLQFCQHNVYNLVLPTYYIEHRQDLKEAVHLPAKSVRFAYKGKDKYHSLVGFTKKEWKSVWKFNWDKRKTFAEVEGQYAGTYLVDFYHHDLHTGPLKSFDIPYSEYQEA